MATSPLETVVRNHGAAMVKRHGRLVPAHFGSTSTEESVCLRSVGMADRSDRETFVLRGTPEAVEQALVTFGDTAWCSFLTADSAIARCEQADAAACTALLRNLPDISFHVRTGAYAAIGLIGPRAQELLTTIDLNPSGLVIQEARDCFEVILPAAHGPELWDRLLEAGAQFDLACVGHDALDRLAASRRMGHFEQA
jgi:glycine cleavage system aminomethyltransferase T